MNKPATIRDVAEAAEVSAAAVSRVLNDGPVSAAVRARVLAAIEQLDYRPRTAARELRNQPSTTIGLVVADVTNPFFARLADHIAWEARSRGAQVVLLTTREDARLEAAALDTLLARRVAGVIATPTADGSTAWARLANVGSRLVFVDRSLPDIDADVVRIDNEAITRTATRHLLDAGHSRVGIVAGPDESSTGRERIAGYLAAHADAGIPVDEALIRRVPFRDDVGGGAVGALLDLAAPATALLLSNTAQAVSCARRLRTLGIRIPEDLSVIAFGDEPWTELFDPAITVVRQPISLLASHAVELAMRTRGDRETVSVSADLVLRSSTAARA